MKVVIAIDSLKGSLSSVCAGKSIEIGIKRVFDAEVVIKPLADGGEGTVEALVTGMNGMYQSTKVTGPLGEAVHCSYGILNESKTAIIEMSAAAGITLVPDQLKNPMNTTTFGVGEVIKDAIEKGCRNFIVGIGGSSTNDGGVGMLQALGFEFLDKQGREIEFGAKGLKELVEIRSTNIIKALNDCKFKIACDVNNPLCGPQGASFVFGPQKGATPEMVEEMDGLLRGYAEIVRKTVKKDCFNVPGAGAAGGMGYAFVSFLNAELESGVEIILKEIGLEEDIKNADIVITGEGMLDFQTSMGKAPIGVAKLAKKYHKKVIAFSGGVTEDARECNNKGIDAYFPIIRKISTLEEAMNPETAAKNLTDTVEQVFKLIKSMQQI